MAHPVKMNTASINCNPATWINCRAKRDKKHEPIRHLNYWHIFAKSHLCPSAVLSTRIIIWITLSEIVCLRIWAPSSSAMQIVADRFRKLSLRPLKPPGRSVWMMPHWTAPPWWLQKDVCKGDGNGFGQQPVKMGDPMVLTVVFCRYPCV